MRKSGDRIRVTAQLVDGATGAHLWSQTYDRDLKDVIAVQSDVAAAVAESLEVTLAVNGRSRQGETNNAEAFEHYLQGRYFYNRRGTGDRDRAQKYFEEAVQIDPAYARAWAGLAASYFISMDANKAVPEEIRAKWHEAVKQALAFGPDLPEVQMRAAQYYMRAGNAKKAREHYQRAKTLGPSDPLVLAGSIPGPNMSETLSLLRRLVSIDPLSASTRANLGVFLVAAGQYEDAKSELTQVLEISHTQIDVRAELAKILILQQRFSEALTAAQALPDSYYRNSCLALLAHATGNAASADAELAHLISRAEAPGSVADVKLAIAEVYAFRGMHDEAFNWLELVSRQTYDERAMYPAWWTQQELPLSPFLKPLQGDPRWRRVLDGVDAGHVRPQ